jgi:hypothetical protein
MSVSTTMRLRGMHSKRHSVRGAAAIEIETIQMKRERGRARDKERGRTRERKRGRQGDR